MLRRVLLGVATVAAPVLAAPPTAGAGTGQILITATVQAGCALGGGSLDFGRYVSGQAADLDATGRIEFSDCFGELVVELDGGQGGVGVGDRAMQGPGGRLRYQMYRDAGRSSVWGAGGQAHRLQLLTGQSGSILVFGRIFSKQTLNIGLYNDTIMITMNFD